MACQNLEELDVGKKARALKIELKKVAKPFPTNEKGPEAADCKYIYNAQLLFFRNNIDEKERLLNGYIDYLEKNIKYPALSLLLTLSTH